jgi:hypothetical protein
MEALKRVAADLLMKDNDRIGLVVYASEAYTKHQSPVIPLFWRPSRA